MKKLIIYLLLIAILLTLGITGGCTIRNRSYVRKLIAAMANDDEEEFDKLLKKVSRYNINSYDSGWLMRLIEEGNYTALQYACQYGYIQYAEKLLEAGADPNTYSTSLICYPALIWAIIGSNCDKKYELVKLLLDYGADANSVFRNGNYPALWLVVFSAPYENYRDNLRLAKLLIEYGAKKETTFLEDGKYITVYESAVKEEKMAYFGWSLEEIDFLKP